MPCTLTQQVLLDACIQSDSCFRHSITHIVCMQKGGNSGLGVETARALAHAGARVILTSRKLSAGEEVVTKLKSDGVKVPK